MHFNTSGREGRKIVGNCFEVLSFHKAHETLQRLVFMQNMTIFKSGKVIEAGWLLCKSGYEDYLILFWNKNTYNGTYQM